MKKITILLFFNFIFNFLYSQPDTLLFEKGRMWIKLKKELDTVNVKGLKKAFQISAKNEDFAKINNVKKVFHSNDSVLSKIYELNFSDEKDIAKYLQKYMKYIDYVEYIPKPIPDNLYTPNDYINSTDTLWHIDHLGLREAWNLIKTQGITNKTKIAIIDNGFDEDHEDLIDNIKYIEPGAGGDYGDGHGTRVAGLAGMTTNNNIGYSSVAGEFCDLYLYYYLNAPDDIIDAANRGCKVINMSFRYACNSPSETYINAINYAYNKGVFVVASGGNCSCSSGCTSYQYPACHHHVFAVASLEQDDTRNTDCHTSYYDKIDLSAPGIKMTTTNKSNSYSFTSQCTSAAAPIVSGTACLVLAVNPIFTPDDVEKILKETAFDIYHIPGNMPYIGKLGAGRVDALNAVECAIELSKPSILSGGISGNYENYHINITHAVTTGDINIKTKDLTINGPFEAGLNNSLIIDNDFIINCN